MKKKLLIVSGRFNSKDKIKFLDRSYEILALTPISMLFLSKLEIPFKTTDDFANKNEYREDCKNIQKRLDLLFLNFDKICRNYFDFPFAYSGNCHYFLYTILDLLYLDKICDKVKKTYSTITYYGELPLKKNNWNTLEFSNLVSGSGRIISLSLTKGLDKKIELICNALNVKAHQSGILHSRTNLIFINIMFKNYLYKYKYILKKIFKILKIKSISFLFFIKNFLKNNKIKTIFIVQDNYEMEQLKPELQKYKLIYQEDSNRLKVSRFSNKKYNYEVINELLEPLISKYFSFFNNHIKNLFKTYHREIVGRIPFYLNTYESLINDSKPSIHLCSVGTRDIVDCIINYIANKKNIPVIFFQHGGTLIFFNDEYQKYVGADYKIKKTLILSSYLEKNTIKSNNTSFKVFGSMTYYNQLKYFSKDIHKNKKALYCTTPFLYENYRSLSNSDSDKQHFQINNSLIDAAKKCSITMDIKTHPIGANDQVEYFIELAKIKNYTSGKIIGKIPAESILSKYGLIIIDSLGSAMLPYLLSLKTPIILYLKDLNLINKNAYNDLNKRCYIVSNELHLMKVLQKYKKRRLDHKWTKEIIDKYVYPLEDSSPKKNITKYIDSLL